MCKTITVEAIYQDGVLKPKTKLDLRPNELVQVQIVRQSDAEPQEDLGPLAGAFPELAAITNEDIEWAKQAWERGLAKQLRTLADEGAQP